MAWTFNRFRFLKLRSFLTFLTFLGAPLFAAQEGNVEFRNGVFRASPAEVQTRPPTEWESIFTVYAQDSTTPMLGTYAVEGRALVFHPRFPAITSIGYHGFFNGRAFSIPPPSALVPATRVDHVYPSVAILPANTLKLYIAFSAPMSMGEASQNIRLFDDAGAPVPGAFLELEQELWDPEHQRLTVLFDPGRIKRGLVPAREAGTPILEGHRYLLTIDRGWHDARGVPLVEGFQKAFLGGPADRLPPAPSTWRLTPPPGGSAQPLIVNFPKPMDYALLQKMLAVPGVAGTISISREETEWRFTPDRPWKPGRYRLSAGSILEDISGNHLDRPFDADKHQPPGRPTTFLPFTVR